MKEAVEGSDIAKRIKDRLFPPLTYRDYEMTIRIADRYFEPFVVFMAVVICLIPVNKPDDVMALWVCVVVLYLSILQIIHYRFMGGRTRLLAYIEEMREQELIEKKEGSAT